MKNALKSEFLKLLTVRSTIVWSAIPLFFVLLGTFYIQGFKSSVYDQTYFTQAVTNSATIASFFVAIIAVLHMAHEYRYNTITYSLTLSDSRNKVLAAKIITILGFSVVFTAFIIAISVGSSALGAALSGHSLPHQDFQVLEYFAQGIFYVTGFAMVGLLVTVLIRNLAASIVVLFIVPNTIEGILSLLLKHDAKYLPFHAINNVLYGSIGIPPEDYLSIPRAALVFLAYLVVGWAIAWWLFLRRDAN